MVYLVHPDSIASPATLSRNFMVYLESMSLGWKVLFDSWAAKLPLCLLLKRESLFIVRLWVVDHLLDFIRSNIEESSQEQNEPATVPVQTIPKLAGRVWWWLSFTIRRQGTLSPWASSSFQWYGRSSSWSDLS